MSRKVNSRRTKTSIAIVCEGVTEHSYFENLKTKEKYPFEIKPHLPQHSDINGIFKKAKELINKEFDIVFCVFDFDVLEKEKSLRNKYSRIQHQSKKNYSNKILFIESMPCFELWLLIHFDKYQKYTNKQNDIIIELRKFLKSYQKGNIGKFFPIINEKINEAINNALELEKIRYNNVERKISYTDVHKIILKLKELRLSNS